MEVSSTYNIVVINATKNRRKYKNKKKKIK